MNFSKALLILLLTVTGSGLLAQGPIKLALHNKMGLQAGIGLSGEIPLTSFGKEHYLDLIIEPELSYITQPGINHKFRLLGQIGVRKRNQKHRYHSLYLGFGSQLQQQETERSINLGDGSFKRSFETQWFWTPQIRYEMGFQRPAKLGWFWSTFFGQAFSVNHGHPLYFGLSLGLRL
ncbi:MAG: hypothetical protein AAFV80_13260 [Bacteroidota bacterium]